LGKLHVILKKEEIDSQKAAGKIVVVLDVLMATSMIAVALQYGAGEVIPVRTHEEGKEALEDRKDVLAVGEYQGRALEGFLLPTPTELKEKVTGKTMVLSTTNGTVAILKSLLAKTLYAASLLNGEAVAKVINKNHMDETVLIVCSGSGGTFSLEDHYGAGYLVHEIKRHSHGEWQLTDAALGAYYFYEGHKERGVEILQSSRVGRALCQGGYKKEVESVSQQGIYSVVPCLNGTSIVMGGEETICHKQS
jgi:2-phosphosulfolactate phosphatase